MCQGLLEESDGEGEPGEGQDKVPEVAGDQAGEDQAGGGPAARLAAVEKKTEQQRRREKAARKLVSTWARVCCPCARCPSPGLGRAVGDRLDQGLLPARGWRLWVSTVVSGNRSCEETRAAGLL